MAEKKKKKEIEYDIDPSLPEEEQRRLRKQIRAERRKEREERRRRREGVEDLSSPPDSARDERGDETSPREESSSSSARSARSKEEETGPKKGSAAWEWAQKQKEEEAKKKPAPSVASEDVSASAKSAMAAVREKERLQLEEQKRLDELRRRETDEEALKEKRRLDKLARERKALEEEERLKNEELRAQKAQLDAAKREREAKELAVKEAKLREENAKRREEEEKRREEDEAQRRRKEELVRKQQEEERREREKRDAEKAAQRARERAEYEARREEQERRYKEENERAAREHLLQLSGREREELARLEEERARGRMMRERSKQSWAEKVRVAEDKVRSRGEHELDALHRLEDQSNSRKASVAGKETDEFLLNPVAAKSFPALGSLLHLAELTGCKVPRPEWVLIGAKSRAKSNVLDAMLGFPVFKGVDVVRTFYVELVYDAEAELTPSVSFEGDSVRLDIFKLPSEIATRNVAGQAPCRVTLRYRNFWNVLFVVTPDLPEPILPAVYDPERWPVVMSEAAPSDRLLLWIDRCDAEPPFGAQFARMLGILDSKHRRSLLVLNGLSDMLAEMTLGSEANMLLSQTCAVPAFFVSYSLEKNSSSDLNSRAQADEATLKRLGAFDSLRNLVGMRVVAREVQRLTHQLYDRTVLPLALSHLHHRSRQVAEARQKVETDLSSLKPQQLRVFASQRVMNYLQVFRAALRGEDNYALNHGETLADEREHCGQPREAWRLNARVSVSVPTSSVLGGSGPLLGKAAMNRLLSDLTAAVAASPAAEPAADRTLLANMGPAGSGRAPDFVFAAGDVAGKRAREVLRPLVTAAVERAVHIAKHVADAAEQASTQQQQQRKSDVIVHAPFFWAAIRERVYEFIDAQARRCNEAVDDIFRATAFLPVSLLRQLTPMVPTEEADELERLGVLSGSVLEELKARILESTRLILLEHLLDPLDERVQTFVISQMSALPVEEIEGALQPEAVSARLLEEQCKLEQEAALVAEYLRIFSSHAHDFSVE